MTNYTPGPWAISPSKRGIKTVYGRPGMDDSQLEPVRLLGEGINLQANARLIAAAPKLLEQLESLCAMAERARSILQSGPHGGNWGMLDTSKARAVITSITQSQGASDEHDSDD